MTGRMKKLPAKSTKMGASKKRSRDEAGDAVNRRRHRPDPHCMNLAKEWKKAKLKTEDLFALVNSGFLCEKEMDLGSAATGNGYPVEKNPDKVPMFAWFVEHGLKLPASNFFKGMLRYYGIEYLNLNPNGIFHNSTFVHFFEAFMGIKSHWIVFRKFFQVKPQPSVDDP
jgi:hypothetical protein